MKINYRLKVNYHVTGSHLNRRCGERSFLDYPTVCKNTAMSVKFYTCNSVALIGKGKRRHWKDSNTFSENRKKEGKDVVYKKNDSHKVGKVFKFK